MPTRKPKPKAWHRQPSDTDESWHAFFAFLELRRSRDGYRYSYLHRLTHRWPLEQLQEWYWSNQWERRAILCDLNEGRETMTGVYLPRPEARDLVFALSDIELNKLLAYSASEKKPIVSAGQLVSLMRMVVTGDWTDGTPDEPNAFDLDRLDADDLLTLKALQDKCASKWE